MTSSNNKKTSNIYLQKAKDYLVKDILGTTDSAHRIALGVAIGMFVAFTPTIPFQMALTALFCFIFRANIAVGLPAVWITNPATIIPIYLPQYFLGCYVLGLSPKELNWQVLVDTSLPFWDYCLMAWDFMTKIMAPLWVGSCIVSILLGLLSYVVVRYVIKKYRRSKFA